MGLLGQMTVRFGGDTSGLTGAVGEAKKVLQGMASGNPMAAVGMGFVAAASAAVGFAAASTKMAGNFQEATTTLVTGAGESAKNLELIRSGLLDISVQTGSTTQQLISGMFMIESAGFHGAAGLNVVKVAAEGAKVGGADLGVVANTLTTILHDYGMSGDQAAQAMNGLTATVQNGKMHLQDLASSMGSVLPLASSLHIQFPVVAGAIAEMTNSGMGAQRASMNLANSLRSLAAPGATAQKTMKAIGLDVQGLHDTLTAPGGNGLYDALQLVEHYISQKYPAGSVQATAALKAIMGGATGLNVALMLGGKNLQGYGNNITAITNAMQNGKGAVTGWSEVQGDFNFKVSQAKAALDAFMIKIGTALLPILTTLMSKVTPIIQGFSDWIGKSGNLQGALGPIGSTVKSVAGPVMHLAGAIFGVVQRFIAWNDKTHLVQNVLGDVGGIIQGVAGFVGGLIDKIADLVTWMTTTQGGGVALYTVLGIVATILSVNAVQAVAAFVAAIPGVIGGFVAWAIGAWSVAAANIAAFWPIYLVVGAIILIIGLVVLAVKNWGAIAHWLQQAWSAVAGFFVGIWNAIRNGVGAFFSWLGGTFHGFWNGIVSFVQGVLQNLLSTITAPFRAIGALFSWLYDHNTYFKMLADKIHEIVSSIVNWLMGIWHNIVTWITDRWNLLKNTAIAIFSLVYLIIETKITQVRNFVTNILTTIGNFFRDKWNDLVAGVALFWGKIHDFFAGAWSRFIQSPIGQIFTNIANFFMSLPGKALEWGKNMIQGFINGIKNMLGNLGSTLGNVAHTIGNFLGFHSPAKEGEGRELDAWPRNMVAGYAKGMIAALPTMIAALNVFMKPVASTLSGQTTATASRYTPSTTSGNGTQGQQDIYIQLDGQTLAHVTGNRQARMVRLKMARRAA